MSTISLDFLELFLGYAMFIKIDNIVDPTDEAGAYYTDLSEREFSLWVLENPDDATADALVEITEADVGDRVTLTDGEMRVKIVSAAESALLTRGRTYTIRGQIDDSAGEIHPFNFEPDDTKPPKFYGHFNVI